MAHSESACSITRLHQSNYGFNVPYGGPARNRTGVHDAFAWKGLQQFFRIDRKWSQLELE